MIDEIVVKNVALIREASMTPATGLTVLTGETGAGKTALISACKLLMGERADKGSVREGCEAAEVEGRFFVTDEELVVTRRVSADGRSRATLNGHMASIGELADSVSPSIDLCGQHEHQALMKPSNHVRMLDAWMGEDVVPLRDAYAAAFDCAREAAMEYARVLEMREASGAALDEARFVLRKIDAVDPQEDEYEQLSAQVARSEHAETLARAASVAYEGLMGGDCALDHVETGIQALLGAARYDESLSAYAQSLREACYVLEDVARDMLTYRDKVEFDPEELAFKQERLAALQGLMRTYGPRMEDVLARRAEAADMISMVDDADERERMAKKALNEAEARLEDAAASLHEARMTAAPNFAQQVTQVLGRLEMGTARLTCQVELQPRDSWTKTGPSQVEFFFCPGAQLAARPLATIASGGEMSRVMLAVKAVMGDRDEVETLVFDEVDAGVGGATALALARVLAELALTHQVIVITHLAQLAVAASVHYVVEKTGGDEPVTSLREVTGADREHEIARMLSGDATETSLKHAKEMLAGAQA
ncbi:MAG: DNA repair protein RecN [Eggerthellaceae bacterium]|nr:DNA repair protein RecN [Eggerthellaceae bacterium]